MGAVHSKARNRMANTRVLKLTAVVTNTKMLDAAGKPGFGIEEKGKAVPGSDQGKSGDDYVSDTDDEMDLEKPEAEGAQMGMPPRDVGFTLHHPPAGVKREGGI